MTEKLTQLVDNCYYYDSVLSNIYHSDSRGYKIIIKNWDDIRKKPRYEKLKQLITKWVQQHIDPMTLIRANYELRNGDFYFERMGHTQKTIKLYYEWLKDKKNNKQKNTTNDIDFIKKEILNSVAYIQRYCDRKGISINEYFSCYRTKLVPDILVHIKKHHISYFLLIVNRLFLQNCSQLSLYTDGIVLNDYIDMTKMENAKNILIKNKELKEFIKNILIDVLKETK